MDISKYSSIQLTTTLITNQRVAKDSSKYSLLVIHSMLLCSSIQFSIKTSWMLVVVGGLWSMILGKAFPDLRCINFDLPHVVAGLEGYGNVKHVEGDMFESIPQADAALLKWTMHDWIDEECIKVPVNCKKAIAKENDGKGGKVIIIDMVVSSKEKAVDNEAAETQLLFDMFMMTLMSGREWNEKEWADIFEKFGFKTYKITHVLGLRSVIEVFP